MRYTGGDGVHWGGNGIFRAEAFALIGDVGSDLSPSPSPQTPLFVCKGVLRWPSWCIVVAFYFIDLTEFLDYSLPFDIGKP